MGEGVSDSGVSLAIAAQVGDPFRRLGMELKPSDCWKACWKASETHRNTMKYPRFKHRFASFCFVFMAEHAPTASQDRKALRTSRP